ncbi:hypothetical protein RLEG12_25715 [Rhizobium leguminosarum bv. trifolii CB782]|uniref:hypothetical protein n=1 Tax=Rhizobium hidalgonense TaxID=1538159 RepID=UPI0003E2EB59|nr:hypothetical protein [Rhizobium hidalgonense]AHG46427.1 hypothetical protein RLEG12_25715 [Rhizobium leguminosarum bv. trifolii CB782]RWX12166.1 hypothetical protein EHI42_23145 [Rhizobium hidalgonense]
MATNTPTAGWAADVVDFLSRNIPRDDREEGWNDMALTAYQIGCEALVALGQADETNWGAIPRKNARLPLELPRWDDLSVSVLRLAAQQKLLSYRRPDGSVPLATGHWLIRQIGAPPPPPPNIAAANGLGPAFATPEALSVLQALGLLAEGRWTMIAETVFWRDWPEEWEMDFTSDPHFSDAVEQALATIPADIRTEMDKLVTITDAQVAAEMQRSAAVAEEWRAKYGPKAEIISSSDTPKRARTSLEFIVRHELDWLFFRRWRLADGWLASKEADKALGIFHDDLAIAMRCAVVKRLYPHLPFAAGR